MTNLSLHQNELRPNLAVNKSIDSIRDKISEEQRKIKSRLADIEYKEFIDGLDDIGLTLKKNNKIDIHEEKIHNAQPWIV